MPGLKRWLVGLSHGRPGVARLHHAGQTGSVLTPRTDGSGPHPSDEALIAGMAVGDDRATVAFVRRYQKRVYGLAIGMLGDPRHRRGRRPRSTAARLAARAGVRRSARIGDQLGAHHHAEPGHRRHPPASGRTHRPRIPGRARAWPVRATRPRTSPPPANSDPSCGRRSPACRSSNAGPPCSPLCTGAPPPRSVRRRPFHWARPRPASGAGLSKLRAALRDPEELS